MFSHILKVFGVALLLILAAPLLLLAFFASWIWHEVLDILSRPHVAAASTGDLLALERLLSQHPWRFQIAEAVVAAIMHQQPEALKILLTRGQWPVDAELEWRGSALHLAVVVGNEELVRVLLSCGANSNIGYPDFAPRTPLSWAADHGCVETVDMLLNHGANPAGIKVAEIGKNPPLKGVYSTPERIEAVKELVAKAQGRMDLKE